MRAGERKVNRSAYPGEAGKQISIRGPRRDGEKASLAIRPRADPAHGQTAHIGESEARRRPPAARVLLGVLLVVVGIQFLSLGLLSELLTSQHRERLRATGDRTARLVDEILR